jgi:hypothetical protein
VALGIGGPNAFSIVPETFEAFAEAVLKKLIAKIVAVPPESQPSPCRGLTAESGERS